MGLFILFVVLFCTFMGALLLLESLWWYVRSFAVEADVIGFQSTKSKGRFLPLVQFDDMNGNAIKARVKSTDNLKFIIIGVEEGHVIGVRHAKKNPKIVRFPGFMNIAAGVSLQLPLPLYASYVYGDVLEQAQMLWLMVLFFFVFGAWGFLWLIRFFYTL